MSKYDNLRFLLTKKKEGNEKENQIIFSMLKTQIFVRVWKKNHIVSTYNIYQQDYDKTLFSKVCLSCPEINFLVPYPCSEHHIHGKKHLPQQLKQMKNKMQPSNNSNSTWGCM